jgi:hypothetical protein
MSVPRCGSQSLWKAGTETVFMPTGREIIMAEWFDPEVDPDYKAACDRAAEREEGWHEAEREPSESVINGRALL